MQYFQTIVCWAVYARKNSSECVDAVRHMRVCRAADNNFVGYKGTKSLSIDKHLPTENILLWRVSGGYIFAALWKKYNRKNLRREVQKQLKELRGGVGEQASLATINGEEKSFNFNLS